MEIYSDRERSVIGPPATSTVHRSIRDTADLNGPAILALTVTISGMPIRSPRRLGRAHSLAAVPALRLLER
jgi:hypothetical protein